MCLKALAHAGLFLPQHMCTFEPKSIAAARPQDTLWRFEIAAITLEIT